MVNLRPQVRRRGASACDGAKAWTRPRTEPLDQHNSPGTAASFRCFETSDLARGNANENMSRRRLDAAGYRRAQAAIHGSRDVDALVGGTLPRHRRAVPSAISIRLSTLMAAANYVVFTFSQTSFVRCV
jgi:hypothetical protein